MTGLDVIVNVSLISIAIVVTGGLIAYYTGAFKMYKRAFGKLRKVRALEKSYKHCKDYNESKKVTYMNDVLTVVEFRPIKALDDNKDIVTEGYRIKTFAKVDNGEIVRSIKTIEIQLFRYSKNMDRYDVAAEYYLRNKLYNWIFINLLFKKYASKSKSCNNNCFTGFITLSWILN